MNRHKQWPLTRLTRALSRSHSSLSSSVEHQPAAAAASFPLKHVTISNFESALVDLRSRVRAADFVAIDLEMTGITSAPWRESLELDRYDIRYLKVKDSAEKFAVVQFGVCPFRWDSATRSFIAHPYNFFVFPRKEPALDDPPHEFLCQTTSMDFLAKYQFDFNVCIHEGVSYLSRAQEEAALKRLELVFEDEELDTARKLNKARDVKLVRMSDILFAERMKNTLNEWRDGLLRGGNTEAGALRSLNDSSQRLETIFYKMHPALNLKGFSSHQVRLIGMVAGKHFKDLSYVHVKDESFCSQELVVYTDSERDKELLMKEVKDEHKRFLETKIESAIGFRRVIDLLSSEQKLIVGHNCFLDIAHIYNKFVGPLPSTAEEFVSVVNKYFPHIVDTKILLNTNDILQRRMKRLSTSLSSAFSLLCPQIALGSERARLVSEQFVKIDVEVDDIRSSNWKSGAKHEAGYDAFMTGCVFAQACSHLGVDFKLQLSSGNISLVENLHPYLNRLYLSWTSGDIIELPSSKRTAEYVLSSSIPKRFMRVNFENVILIWGFPTKLRAREIKECICKVFGPKSATLVYHVDESAVFVLFSKPELVSDFLALKQHLEKNNDPISVLHPLAKLFEGGNTRAYDYEAYKEICSSPISEVLFADQAEAAGIKWSTHNIKSEQADLHDEHSAEKYGTAKTDSIRNESSFNRSSYEDMVDSFRSSSEELKQVGTSSL